MVLRSTLLLLVALLLGLPAPALQDDAPPTERERLNRALGVLRDRRASSAEQDAAIEELLSLGAEGPRRLVRHAEQRVEALAKQCAKDAKGVLADFDKAAGRVLDRRLDKAAQKEVEEARAVIRRNARDASLTKEQIVGESDPAFARLEELLVVTPGQVWEADEELFHEWSELLDALDEEARWRGVWQRARAALAEDPDGARQAARMEPPVAGDWTPASMLDVLDRHAWRATPMGSGDPRVLDANLALASEIDAEELAGIRAHNRRRILIGLHAQLIDVKLCAAGRGHSQDMEERGFFAHESPVPGKRSFGDRASLAGTSANAENIAVGARKGPDVIMQWWYSPGHHRNMLGGQARIGLGRHGAHWTEMFG